MDEMKLMRPASIVTEPSFFVFMRQLCHLAAKPGQASPDVVTVTKMMTVYGLTQEQKSMFVALCYEHAYRLSFGLTERFHFNVVSAVQQDIYNLIGE